MKKLFKTFIILSMLIACILMTSGNASAASYDTIAQTLSEFGLLSTTANSKNFELENAPTRAQAAVMIVRLMGKESKVRTDSYSHPFIDVPKWADNYVGYLYQNSLISGTTSTTFGADEKCSKQAYITFVLRVLGYSDKKGDFSYSNAQEFATKIGLISSYDSYFSSLISSKEFNRGDMVGITYSALFIPTNTDQKTCILQNLVDSACVDKGIANKYLNNYKTYRRFIEKCMSSQNQSIAAKITADIEMSASGESTSMSYKMSQSGDVKVIQNDTSPQAQFNMNISYLGRTSNMSMYFKDGWCYTSTDSSKYKTVSTFDQALNSTQYKTAVCPFYMIDEITETKTLGKTTYKIKYASFFIMDLYNSFLSLSSKPNDISIDMDIKDFSCITIFNSDSTLDSQTVSVDMNMSATQNEKTQSININYKVFTDITATGSFVTITPPDDLDNYIDLSKNIRPKKT